MCIWSCTSILNFRTTRGDVLIGGEVGRSVGRSVYRVGANYSLLAVTREIHSVSRANDHESVYYFSGVVGAGCIACTRIPVQTAAILHDYLGARIDSTVDFGSVNDTPATR